MYFDRVCRLICSYPLLSEIALYNAVSKCAYDLDYSNNTHIDYNYFQLSS